MKSILDLKIGSGIRKGVVDAVRMEKVPDREGLKFPKIILSINESNGNHFLIDYAWVKEIDGSYKSRSLWLKRDAYGCIRRSSTVAKLMAYYRAETLRDLIGRGVLLFPKPNGYIGIVATDGIENGSLPTTQPMSDRNYSPQINGDSQCLDFTNFPKKPTMSASSRSTSTSRS